jgi:hypothetical protein
LQGASTNQDGVIVVRVSLVRTGGFTGLRLTSSVDTDELPAQVRDGALKALDRLVADPPAIPAWGAAQPRYALTVAHPSGSRVIEIVESQIPAGLRPLISELVRQGS